MKLPYGKHLETERGPNPRFVDYISRPLAKELTTQEQEESKRVFNEIKEWLIKNNIKIEMWK